MTRNGRTNIIHQQFNREPESGDIFIMMSKDRRKVRLFNYDTRSCCLHEKKFHRGYEFMKVIHEGDKEIYSIQWEDIVLLLESPVIKELKVK